MIPLHERALSCAGLSIGYRQNAKLTTVVAKNLDLDLFHGEVVCLVGPNGAGKSTLLRTLTGLQHPIEGVVYVDGKDLKTLDIKARARRIGVVLTERINVGILPAFDLVSLGRHPHTDWTGRLTDEDISVVEWALEAVGASELSNRNVNELSDGELQKIMIARALAQEPTIIVLDEPTAFLDLPRRVEVMGLLKRLARSTDRAVLLSTHDLDLAIRASDRMWLMDSAGTVQSGAPEDLILQGGLEQVFASEGVAFDDEHGSFHLVSDTRGYVGLEGVGPAATWTRRALRRAGFEIGTSSLASCMVTVHHDDDGTTWRVAVDDKIDQCVSIFELIQIIETKHVISEQSEKRANNKDVTR